MLVLSFFVLSLLACATAHITAWTKGMYCKNGLSHTDEPNADYPMNPVFDLTYEQWFMHGECRNYPPPAGEFLELPAGGEFLAELSANRAFTSLSYSGTKVTGWADGKVHPYNYSVTNNGGYGKNVAGCLDTPNLHTKDRAGAAGTVFAIAYKSNLADVTMKDLTVFTVAYNTPFQTKVMYKVPADMPACPAGGCICAWGWVPNGCGLSNVYMNGFRCMVTGARADAPKVAAPQAPQWCENDATTCVTGAKQMVIYHQAEANTVTLDPTCIQKDGEWCSPGYNMKMGFRDGAQNDIFETVAAASSPPPSSSAGAHAASSSSKAAPAAASSASSSGSSADDHEPTSCSSGRSRRSRHRRRHESARKRLLMGL